MMTKEEFLGYRDKYQAKIEKIRQRAHELHENVNQIYGDDLPYGFHLDMVAEGVEEFGSVRKMCCQFSSVRSFTTL